ncbi:hypothetical protein SCP_0603190 [Sparassis crispa]|uniref:Uncharacterized protein n=1 Tax=Sparassis crispa TaxID=139825 RepID=A0A401GQ32_9APHY|nr:hypothetical protein SCP_0603190 [Sparassis crispa]GBE84341.1 hypothetical protein SCP_0603190 [Sparassis crispa]
MSPDPDKHSEDMNYYFQSAEQDRLMAEFDQDLTDAWRESERIVETDFHIYSAMQDDIRFSELATQDDKKPLQPIQLDAEAQPATPPTPTVHCWNDGPPPEVESSSSARDVAALSPPSTNGPAYDEVNWIPYHKHMMLKDDDNNPLVIQSLVYVTTFAYVTHHIMEL